MKICREIFYKGESQGAFELYKENGIYFWAFCGYDTNNLEKLDCTNRKVYEEIDLLIEEEDDLFWFAEFKEEDLKCN